MPQLIDGGGGGSPRPGHLVLIPSGSIDLGNVVIGATGHVSVEARNTGTGTLTVTNIAFPPPPRAEWLLSGIPSLPHDLAPNASFTFTLSLTPTVTGLRSVTLLADWRDVFGNEPEIDVAVTGTGVAASGAIFDPAALAFTTTQVGKTTSLNVLIRNVGTVTFNVTALALTTGTQYSFTGAPTPPFAILAGNSQSVTVTFAPLTVGALSDILTATTDVGGSPTLAIQGLAVFIFPIAIIPSNIKRVVVGGYDALGLQGAPAPSELIPDSYNSAEDSNLELNGSLWEALGEEKTLFRLGFFYENLGPAQLTFTATTPRPQNGADAYDSVPATASFGTALADGKERYAEVDLVATGEQISLSMARTGATGPVSLCALVPYFSKRGEKVPGT